MGRHLKIIRVDKKNTCDSPDELSGLTGELTLEKKYPKGSA